MVVGIEADDQPSWRRPTMKYVMFALLAVVTTLTACTGGKSEDSSKADSAAE